jgi:hypothetical protein
MDEIVNIGHENPVGLHLDETAVLHLKETSKWAKFLSIVGMVMMAFVLIIGLIMVFSVGMFSSMSPNLGPASGMMGVGIGILYLLMAALYVYPIWKLYQFANFSQQAIASRDSQLLTQAMEAQKSMYKFMGILLAILLSIYALTFVLGFLGMAMFSLGK